MCGRIPPPSLRAALEDVGELLVEVEGAVGLEDGGVAAA